jgi:hypothetical protein
VVCEDHRWGFVFIFPWIELAFEARSELSQLRRAAADAYGGRHVSKTLQRNKCEYFDYIVGWSIDWSSSIYRLN